MCTESTAAAVIYDADIFCTALKTLCGLAGERGQTEARRLLEVWAGFYGRKLMVPQSSWSPLASCLINNIICHSDNELPCGAFSQFLLFAEEGAKFIYFFL